MHAQEKLDRMGGHGDIRGWGERERQGVRRVYCPCFVVDMGVDCHAGLDGYDRRGTERWQPSRYVLLRSYLRNLLSMDDS